MALLAAVLPRVAVAQPAAVTADEMIRNAEVPPPVEPGAAAAARPPLPRVTPEQAQPLGVRDANRGASLTLHALSLRDHHGPVTPPAGRRLLLIDTEWENIVPLTLIQQKQVPTEYQIPNLADHLYLLVNGREVSRLHPDADGLPGHVKVREFKLPRLGDRHRGYALFEAPAADAIRSLELRFYDFAHGHMALPLVGPEQPLPEPQPLTPPLKNEVVEAAVFGVKKVGELNGKPAPAGMTYVVADLRARSMFTFDADATAFDPKARPGSKMQIGTVADWTEAHKYLQLVADGEYAYAALPEATTLAAAPRFLPDVFTGGQVAFLAPAETKSVELRCDFPNARTPSGQVIRPKGLTLAVEGTRPQPPKREAIASIDDDIYKVTVVGQSAPAGFAGAKAADGKRFVVLDVSVLNAGKDGEFFQTTEQLKFVTAAAEQLDVDAATWQGVHRPTELVWIPPGERRTFQVAYQVPANDAKPQLGYAGVSKAEVVPLKPLDAAVAATPAQADAPKTEAPKTETPMAAGATKAEAPKGEPPEPDAPKDAPKAEVPANTEVATATPAKPEPPKAQASKPPAQPAREPGTVVHRMDLKEFKVPVRVPAKQPHKPKGIAGVGLTPDDVNTAIDRGAEWLWTELKTKDLTRGYELGYRGEHMIASLALVHAGAHKKFPDFDAALRKYLASYDPLRSHDTYQNGIYCMLIQSYGDPTFLPKLRTTAQWLVDTQGAEGTWGYGFRRPGDEKPAERQLVRPVLQVAGGRPLDEPAGGQPLARTIPWDKGADGDNSVTQYALLGLHAAGRFDIEVPRETWERTLATHRKRQDKATGGFAYTTGSQSSNYGSMTAAGVCALALARHELGEADPAVDPDVEEGLGWLATYFTVDGNPMPQWGKPAETTEWQYYYLYSLERVGRILDTEFIGEFEWYPLGAKYLLGEQRPEGAWHSETDRNDPVLATSFALLFLTRATEALALPERAGPGTLKTAVEVQPSMKIHVILDCSGSMLEEMEGRPKFDIARDAVLSLVDALPKTAQFGLRVYGHRKRATEEGASDDTELLIPIGGVKREVLQAKLRELRARGKTPMAKSLLDAKGDLRGGTEEDPITVILLTDGGEDSQPRRDPLAAAEEFGKVKGVKLHVVGFDINRPEWIEQLQGMAARANGQYLPAQASGALQRELKSAVFGTPEEFTIVDASGRPIYTGQFGESRPLPEGKYTFRTVFAGETFAQEFWINAGTTTAVTFDAAQIARALAEARAQGVQPGQQAPVPGAPPPPPASDMAQPPPPQPPAADQPAAGPKFCTSCGSRLAAGAKFCTSCGSKVQ